MKNNKKMLSISVAAYNMERYIERNLNSFVNCKHKDLLEVIVTNDGSTDNTRKIVQKYVEKYPDVIKLINKKNEGAGSTVNSGIKNATGKYFKMVDGDDWVNTDNLDLLIERLSSTDYDMVINNYDIYNSCEKAITSHNSFNICSDTPLVLSDINDMTLVMHSITYKTSIFKENNIVLDNGFYTDQEYIFYPLIYVKSVVYYDFSIYVYMVGREGQSINIESLIKHEDMHELVLKNLINLYKDNLDSEAKELIKRGVMYMFITHFNILLSHKMTLDNKTKIKQFFNYIRDIDVDLYKELKNDKKIFIVLNSKFFLLRFVSYFYRKKCRKDL